METPQNTTDLILGQLIAKADESIRMGESTKSSVADLSREFKESHKALSADVAQHGTRLTVIETEIGTLRKSRFSMIQMLGIMVSVAVGATVIFTYVERMIA